MSWQWNRFLQRSNWRPTATWTVVFGLGAALIWIAGNGPVNRAKLTLALSVASFATGALAGFVFTSYGEENATIGKIRDWLIGGLAGVTIVKFRSLEALIGTFAAGAGPQEFAMTVGLAITFASSGFFFMFFQRELILNVLLAESRARRSRLDGTELAEIATIAALSTLPPSLLSGTDDLDEVMDENQPQAKDLTALLNSDGVTKFLAEAEKAATSGGQLGWDIVSKAAHLHYYRTYTAQKGDEKTEQAELARTWLVRALIMNPHHVDFTAKYADTLGILKYYSDAVKLLEQLYDSSDAPAYIQQWLGYYLLYVNRDEEAIRLSEDYHKRFPDDDSCVFNAAAGYAQLYEDELLSKGIAEDKTSSNRQKALELLREALRMMPSFAATVAQKWTNEDESFYSLRTDSEFLQVVNQAQTPSSSGQ